MARKAREKSELGIYMVSLKGVADVEFDSDDKINFLNIMFKNETFLLSYSMLNNSFLFVIKEDDRAIDVILRKSAIKFVRKYNKKHDREGKVFGGRFTSYAAHTMNDVWKYIGNVHAMMKVNDGVISSSNNYFDNKFIKSEYALRFFDSKTEFLSACDSVAGENSIKFTDEEISNFILNTFQIEPHSISKMPDTLVESMVTEIFKATKASARQLARVTSLPLRLLWAVAKKFNPKPKKKVKVVKNESSST